MLLSITTTHRPATELGFLLHKNPARAQCLEVAAGTAYVCYPEADETRCTASLILDVDPIALVRGSKRLTSDGEGFGLGQYVNDRPYASSSLLAVAMRRVFSTAMTGRCKERPELAAASIPLQISVPAVRCRGGADLVPRFFEPLGWVVEAVTSPLDPNIPEWGTSPYVDVRLTGSQRLADALHHLYVLLPVLDDAKHYWVSSDEVDKLVRAGSGWLESHPEKGLIARRYLAHRHPLTRDALARLAEIDDTEPEDIDNAVPLAELADRPQPLAVQRRGAVLAALRSAGARTVADLGCGEGTLVAELLADRSVERIVAVDVSCRALEIAGRRLRLERMSERQRSRLEIVQGALTCRDDRLKGLDAAVLMEVIEHVDPPRLAALAHTVFGQAAPSTVVVTTPNVEHNARFADLAAGQFRHRDHRFEWTRAQFRRWATGTAHRYRYVVRFVPIGTDDPEVGAPTQMAVFTKEAA
ncbi:MAG: 3' terminal RNA ribose 2'-O-methyltransferase Hen1 [Mycobacteriales bacterium]